MTSTKKNYIHGDIETALMFRCVGCCAHEKYHWQMTEEEYLEHMLGIYKGNTLAVEYARGYHRQLVFIANQKGLLG